MPVKLRDFTGHVTINSREVQVEYNAHDNTLEVAGVTSIEDALRLIRMMEDATVRPVEVAPTVGSMVARTVETIVRQHEPLPSVGTVLRAQPTLTGEKPWDGQKEFAEPLASFPLNGLLCSACRKPQRVTPGGAICENGHGGVAGVEDDFGPATPGMVEPAKAAVPYQSTLADQLAAGELPEQVTKAKYLKNIFYWLESQGVTETDAIAKFCLAVRAKVALLAKGDAVEVDSRVRRALMAIGR